MPAVFATLLGLALGLAIGGRIANLGYARLKFDWAILVLFLVQALARGRIPGLGGLGIAGASLWVLASVGLAGLLLVNWRMPGLAVAAAGILMNVDVVLLNRSMPVTLVRASVAIPAEIGQPGFYRLADMATLLPWLGDVMPLGRQGAGILLSAGDVALVVGVCAAVIYSMVLCPTRLENVQGEDNLSTS
jgi:hypothetical protein